MKLKKSVLRKFNESFSQGRDGMLRYQDRLCVQDGNDLRGNILKKSYGSQYYIHLGATKMYRDIIEVY